jgi:Immunity protein 53
MLSTRELLEKWYRARCNGDWEHQWGVEIGTLDNPGWRVHIDLAIMEPFIRKA